MQAVASMHTDRNLARVLALVMHAVFIALIVIGVSWQRKPPEPVVADLWASLPSLPQPAVPKVAPPPDQQDEPEPPKPVVRAKPVSLVPKAEPKPVVKPDIALQKKPEKEKKAEPKKHDDAADAKRLTEARESREREVKRIADEKEADNKAAAEKVAAAERAEKDRVSKAAVMREMQKYISGIQAKVYARVRVPDDVQGRPEVVFGVTLLPGGELRGEPVMRKSSGNPGYDAAVKLAIQQAQPFVVPSGEDFQQYFQQLSLVFRPQR